MNKDLPASASSAEEESESELPAREEDPASVAASLLCHWQEAARPSAWGGHHYRGRLLKFEGALSKNRRLTGSVVTTLLSENRSLAACKDSLRPAQITAECTRHASSLSLVGNPS